MQTRTEDDTDPVLDALFQPPTVTLQRLPTVGAGEFSDLQVGPRKPMQDGEVLFFPQVPPGQAWTVWATIWYPETWAWGRRGGTAWTTTRMARLLPGETFRLWWRPNASRGQLRIHTTAGPVVVIHPEA